jgi:Uma2 family endonuclease
MPALTLELPRQKTQTAFNLRRWAELLNDPVLANIEGRIETDRHGHILMAPPPAPSHGSYQSEIAYHLRRLLEQGRVLTECPISTADGVKAADVAWASPERMKELGNRACFPVAPEICVEVMSPGNTTAEIREKMALYFDAGAREVWLCAANGEMDFFTAKSPRPRRASVLCPDFPARVQLR